MKTNIFNNTIMKTMKYICLLLMIIGTSASAWATVTDTFDSFEDCGWGFATSDYDDGTYTLGKLTLIGEKVKVNTIDQCIMLTKKNGGGSLTLPSFDGTVSKIKLYTHGNSDASNQEIGIYVNGTYKATVTMNNTNLSVEYTFSPVVAKGAVITLHNESNNVVIQMTKIEVTHEGTAITSGANSITKTNEPAAGGTFTCTVGGNEVSSAAENATVTLTAAPNPGYVLVGFEVTSTVHYCYYPYIYEEDITVTDINSTTGTFTMPDANVVVEAVWDESTTYTVTYDQSKALCAQNGSGSWPANVTDITPDATYSSLPTDIELNGVDGYTFAGWTTNGSYSSSSTAPSPLYTTSITVDADKTLYPVFSNSGSTGGSVTFNRKQNDAMAAGYYLLAIGQSGDQPCLSPTLNTTTYKLDPISASVTSASASVTDRQAMWQVEVSGTYWTIKNVYTGKYLALRISGGDIQNNKIDMLSSVTNDAKWSVIQKGEHYFFQSAANANYYLTYKSSTWYAHDFTGKTDNDINNYSGSIYLYKATTTPGSVTTTYTITPPCTTYTLTYNANGAPSGSVPAAAMEYASGAIVTVLGNSGDLAKTGYDFNGWKTGPSSGTAYAAGSNITMSQDYTLYAQWVAHTIELDLDANGGVSDGSASVKYDATALESGTVHVTGQTGQTLLGYYAAADGDKKVLNATGTFVTPTVADYISSSKWILDESPTTLFAHWRPNTYTVVFNKNDGGDGASGTMSDQVFTYGTPQNLNSNQFSWTSHNFEGWATSPSGGVVYGNGAEVNNLTETDGGTVNLYAVWTNKTYNDYEFTCVDIALTTEDTDPVLVTSRSGINIMATKKLILTVDGTTGTIDLASTDNVLKFYKKIEGTGDNAGKYKYVELTGDNKLSAPITDYEVYVSYAPATAGDGSLTSPRITVTCGANVRNYDNKVIARNLPDEVAIVAKVGGTWQALPANMTTATNPAPVPVVVAASDGILKAAGPSTIGYKLWPVRTAVSTNDRFGTATSDGFPAKLYGDRLRFAGNSDKALWMNNSTSANTINNDGAITAITSSFADDAAYEWEVTTTLSDGNFIYNLKADNGSNTYYLRMKQAESRWGTYANGETNAFYILPLTKKTPAVLTVMEWGTNQIAVSYANGGNASAITAKIDNGGATTVTKNSLGGDLYQLTNVGDLQSNAGKTLTLDITESGAAKQIIFQIPLIVTAEKNLTELRALLPGANATEKGKVASMTDVVVRSGGLVKTEGSTADCSFNDLYVYPGGELAVTTTGRLSLNGLYLRGGYSWLGGSFAMPHALINVAIAGINSTNSIKFDYYIDATKYYDLAVPKTMTWNPVTDDKGSEEVDLWVKQYNGATRASTGKGWEWYNWDAETLNINMGQGYLVAATPKYNRSYLIMRFPLSMTLPDDEATKDPIPVKAYGMTDGDLDDGVSANNAGWNLIANPFLTAYMKDADGETAGGAEIEGSIATGSLEPEYKDGKPTGKYVWDETGGKNVRYVTTYDYSTATYTQHPMSSTKLEPFTGFFIQVAKDCYVKFDASGRQNNIIARRANDKLPDDMEIGITASIGAEKDETILLLCDDLSRDNALEFPDESSKVINAGHLNFYTFAGATSMYANGMTYAEGQEWNAAGITPTKDGEYTFSVTQVNTNYVEAVLLKDLNSNTEYDLLTSDVNIYLETGTIDDRFAVKIVLKDEKETPTALDEINEEGINRGPEKFIYNNKFYIRYNGVIYDAVGKKVREINK